MSWSSSGSGDELRAFIPAVNTHPAARYLRMRKKARPARRGASLRGRDPADPPRCRGMLAHVTPAFGGRWYCTAGLGRQQNVCPRRVRPCTAVARSLRGARAAHAARVLPTRRACCPRDARAAARDARATAATRVLPHATRVLPLRRACCRCDARAAHATRVLPLRRACCPCDARAAAAMRVLPLRRACCRCDARAAAATRVLPTRRACCRCDARAARATRVLPLRCACCRCDARAAAAMRVLPLRRACCRCDARAAHAPPAHLHARLTAQHAPRLARPGPLSPPRRCRRPAGRPGARAGRDRRTWRWRAGPFRGPAPSCARCR